LILVDSSGWIEYLAGRPKRRGASLALALLALCAARAARAEEVGWVARVNGEPQIVRGGVGEPLRRGDAVMRGDRVRTGPAAKVKILLADDSVLAIGPRSEVAIDELSLAAEQRTARVQVFFGRFKLAIAAWVSGASAYEVVTPSAVAGVRGTVLWGDTGLDAICALAGSIEVRTRQGRSRATLSADHCVTGMAKGETAPLTPSREQLADYLREVTLD
jgi:hypothetical protein